MKISKNLNPYVALDIIPSEKNTKKKTKTVKDNSNPEFNERSLINFKYEKILIQVKYIYLNRFDFHLPFYDMRKKQLRIEIKNQDIFSLFDSSIGQVFCNYLKFCFDCELKLKLKDCTRFIWYSV